jgi:hypothetical protein
MMKYIGIQGVPKLANEIQRAYSLVVIEVKNVQKNIQGAIAS